MNEADEVVGAVNMHDLKSAKESDVAPQRDASEIGETVSSLPGFVENFVGDTFYRKPGGKTLDMDGDAALRWWYWADQQNTIKGYELTRIANVHFDATLRLS